MFRAFICSGPESDHNTIFNYIPACTRAEQQANNVFFIHCIAIWNITHQSRHSSSPPAAGGLGFISILLFFSCAEIPAGTAGGKVNGQSLLREGNKGQFPVVQDEKNTETLGLGPHLIFSFQTLQFPGCHITSSVEVKMMTLYTRQTYVWACRARLEFN